MTAHYLPVVMNEVGNGRVILKRELEQEHLQCVEVTVLQSYD